MAQEDSSTRSRLWAHDIEMQWVYRGSGSIVAVGLSWQWVYRDSGGHLDFLPCEVKLNAPFKEGIEAKK